MFVKGNIHFPTSGNFGKILLSQLSKGDPFFSYHLKVSASYLVHTHKQSCNIIECTHFLPTVFFFCHAVKPRPVLDVLEEVQACKDHTKVFCFEPAQEVERCLAGDA